MFFEIVSVGDWPLDDDHPTFPVGSQPKKLLRCPSPPPRPELIPGHRYLFKTAENWQAGQTWAEALAYSLSILSGVEVPRCFIAVDSDGKVGSLIEFFYGYPEEKSTTRFIHGIDFLQPYIVNKRRGRPHGLSTNLLCARIAGIPQPELWWGKVVTFDALIGNTDRHPENWGFLTTSAGENANTFWFAPAYDNGTSLGYQLLEASIPDSKSSAEIEKFVSKGLHHCGWDRSDDGRLGHVDGCGRFRKAHINASGGMRSVIQIDMDTVSDIVHSLVGLHPALSFSAARADFIVALIRTRREKLEAVLGT